MQSIGKPGSVVDDHLSSLIVANEIERVAMSGRIALYAHLLAADRVYLLRMLPCVAVSSYLTPFTLTYRSRRYRFCGTFPRVTPGRR